MDDLPVQLSLGLDLPEDDADRYLSADEIALRKAAARAKLEDPGNWPKGEDGKIEKPYWFDHYIALADGNRWPFRVAVLIAWLATPRKYRWPKTQDELAHLLGMSSDRQFSVWIARNPQIKAAVHGVWKERAMDRLYDSLEAMFEVAADPDYKGKGDRELHFKLADVLRDKIDLTSTGGDADDLLKKLPFRKLMEMAGVDSPEKIAEFKQQIEKELQQQVSRG